MRNSTLIVLIVALTAFVNINNAQTKKKTTKTTPTRGTFVVRTDEPLAPPPAVVRNEDKIDPSEFSNGIFTSKSGNFKIAFTALPKKQTSEINVAYGKTPFVRHTQTTGLINYGVNYFDFPAVIKDVDELKLRYDAGKESLEKLFNTRLVNEQEVYFGDYFGKEYTLENEQLTINLRFFLIEQRLFQIFTITQGKDSKMSEKSRNFNASRVKKFFDSFSVTKLPEVKFKTVELPADFGIKTENSTFRSDFFKLTMPLLKDWYLFKKEETEFVSEVTKQTGSISKSKNKEETALSMKNSAILLMMTKRPIAEGTSDSVVTIGAKKISFPNFLPEVVIESSRKNNSPSEKVLVKNSSENFGGKKFAWTETLDESTGMKTRLYIANLDGIAFEVVILYKNEADLNLLTDSLKQLKFD